jgi:hypothetical protein
MGDRETDNPITCCARPAAVCVPKCAFFKRLYVHGTFVSQALVLGGLNKRGGLYTEVYFW